MANQIQSNKKNVLIGCSGSVACIKVPNIINELKAKDPLLNVSLKIFLDPAQLFFLLIYRLK